MFVVILLEAYYNHGYFNVRVANDEHFGPHGQEITIHLGAGRIIVGHIDREANRNGTARIIAGPDYTEWVHHHFQLGDEMTVTINGPGEITLG